MDFPLFEPRGWGKGFAAQPRTNESEVPWGRTKGSAQVNQHSGIRECGAVRSRCQLCCPERAGNLQLPQMKILILVILHKIINRIEEILDKINKN